METTLLTDPDQVLTSMTGVRREILDALEQPESATGLAAKLGTTRQRVNYHLKALEKAGLVELAEERQRRGFSERLMRRTSDVVVVDPAAFAGLRLDPKETAGLTGVISTASDVIRSAATVAAAASEQGDKLVTATLDSTIRVDSPESLRTLIGEMGALIARYDANEGLLIRFTTTAIPGEET